MRIVNSKSSSTKGYTGSLEEIELILDNVQELVFYKDTENNLIHVNKYFADSHKLNKKEFKTFKLLPILDEIGSIVNHLFVKKGIKMNLIDIEESTHINADPFRFKQILYNLIDNAIKFTEQGQISLKWEDKDSLWEFQIQDTGIGIAVENYDIVFKEFGRIKNDKTLPISGSGIGLALTKRLIELHGGEIWFESEVGKGTTFFFSIPKEYNFNP
ncbi:MAG TPA: HAMP domain-containing sensor histidine kinase [Candidatus Nanopelagicaceae bacterium]|nr:HAMP domain-containing sensor histidine kinase [Candidatus Nanopelagicaceae bacterium]